MAENVNTGEIPQETLMWAHPAEGVTLDDLTLALSRAGTPVIERDEENNRLLVGYDVVGEVAPLHAYDETCHIEGCERPSNHIITCGSHADEDCHWCDMHLSAVRSLLERERLENRPQSDPHELTKDF